MPFRRRHLRRGVIGTPPPQPKVQIADPHRPLWLVEGLKMVGTQEARGNASNPRILQMAKRAGFRNYRADSIPWCFTGETELLTEKGFIRFDQLANERVYQANANGVLSLTKATPVIKDYNGDVFDIDHASVKLTCDVGHRWFGYWNQNNLVPTFRSLEELTSAGLSIPAVCSGSKGCSLTDKELTLLAAFISDGKMRDANGKPWSIEFEVSRPRKVHALTALNPDHVYTHKKVYGPLTKTPLTVFRFLVPSFFSDVFEGYKKLSYSFVNSLTVEQARTFLASYLEFDGDGKSALYSSDKENLDKLVLIVLLAGYHPNVTETTTSDLSTKKAWMIKFSPKKAYRQIKPSHVTRREFHGKLYCVSVPEQRIVVRGQNGTPILTGNCALFANYCLTASGHPGTGSLFALSFNQSSNLIRLPGPAVGAFMPMRRLGGGHIAIVVGRDSRGNIMALGGNQSDGVNIKPFPLSRALSFRWPKGAALPHLYGFKNLPVVSSTGHVGGKES